MTAAEIEKLDSAEQKERDFWEMVQELHILLFPEEYMYQLDSLTEARERAAGINPMSETYIARVEKRRAEMGVSPLAANGLPTLADESWHLAHQKALSLA